LLLDHALDTTVDVAWWPDGVNAFKHDELDTFWILAIIDLAFLFIAVIVTTAKVLQRTNLVTTHTYTLHQALLLGLGGSPHHFTRVCANHTSVLTASTRLSNPLSLSLTRSQQAFRRYQQSNNRIAPATDSAGDKAQPTSGSDDGEKELDSSSKHANPASPPPKNPTEKAKKVARPPKKPVPWKKEDRLMCIAVLIGAIIATVVFIVVVVDQDDESNTEAKNTILSIVYVWIFTALSLGYAYFLHARNVHKEEANRAKRAREKASKFISPLQDLHLRHEKAR